MQTYKSTTKYNYGLIIFYYISFHFFITRSIHIIRPSGYYILLHFSPLSAAAMATTLSKFFSHIYTIFTLFFTLLLVEILILIRSFTRSVRKTRSRLITTTQYLNFIEEKNPTISYKKNLLTKKSPSESKDCAVCLSDFEDGEMVRKLNCKHTFHRDCLDEWLQKYLATCPLCRTKVLPDEIVAKYQQQQNLQHLDYDGGDEEVVFLISLLHGSGVHRLF